MPRFSVKELVDICGADFYGDENLCIDNFAIDSREVNSGSLFIPIVGEKVDAHKFIPTVNENHCKVCLCSDKNIEKLETMTYIYVENTVRALQKIAEFYRGTLNIPIVAVTGSVGKTTSREIISKALSAKYKVYQTKGNGNSQVGVPLTILGISQEDEIAVIEMGVSEPGEMHRIAEVVKPNIAVVTNIGEAHIEFLGSKKGIREEKFHIMDFMKKGDKLFVNADDELLLEAKAYTNIEKVEVFTSDNIKAEYYVENLELIDGLASFVANLKGKKIKCKLAVYGKHQVSNAMLALAVADNFSVDLELAAKKIGEFTGFKRRQNIINLGNIIIIDDTYNASPSSMKAGIDILEAIGGSRKKIAVLADMKELGKDEIELHREIGRYILDKKDISILYTLGDLSSYIAEGAKEKEKLESIIHFTDKDKLVKKLKEEKNLEVVILFKGSNSMKLNEVIEAYMK